MSRLLAVGLVPFEIMDGGTHLVAGLAIGADRVYRVTGHQQGLEWHHYFIVFHKIPNYHQDLFRWHWILLVQVECDAQGAVTMHCTPASRPFCVMLPAMSATYRPPFATILRATFESRPNRFLVLCRLATGERVRAFLPNPGRLQELLLPRAEVFVVPATLTVARKTPYTMVGVAGKERPIFLHTHVNNDVARHLLERGLVPGLEHARIVRAEVPLGHSRFDFLLEADGKPVYLEVKSCTLFGNRVAMFPDAVTARGRRHLEELAALSKNGVRTAVLFVIHSGEVRWFMPDYHTDPAFSRTLLEVRNDIEIIPLAVSWRRDFRLGSTVRQVPIPWEYVARELGDRGNFVVLCRSASSETHLCCLLTGWQPSGLFAFLRTLHKSLTRVGLLVVEHFAVVSSVDRKEAIASSFSSRYPGTASVASPSVDGLQPCGISETDPREDQYFHQLLARFRMRHP